MTNLINPQTWSAIAKGEPLRGCPVEMGDRHRCDRPIHSAPVADGTPVCLMHSCDPKKSDAQFQTEIEATLLKAKEKQTVADFAHFVFPSAKYARRQFLVPCVFAFSRFSRDIDFTETSFSQEAEFGGATFAQTVSFEKAIFSIGSYFRGVTFEQDACFEEIRFEGDTDFEKTKFVGKATFLRATFAQDSNFYDVKFDGEATFNDASFGGQCNFGGEVIFAKKASFDHASFEKEVSFEGAGFADYADFSGAVFEDTEFYGADFHDGASFGGATFNGEVEFDKANFLREARLAGVVFNQNASFNETKFAKQARFDGSVFSESAEFRETEFRSDGQLVPGPIFTLTQFSSPERVTLFRTNLSRALFCNCDVSKINCSLVEWPTRKGNRKRMVFEEIVDINSAWPLRTNKNVSAWPETKENNSTDRDFGLIAELYQQLKRNYDGRGDYWAAGDFHYGEMEMKRLRLQTQNSFARWLHRNLGLIAWYKYASQYGENYVRPILLLLIVLCVFTLVFPIAGLDLNSKTAGPSNELSYRYFAQFINSYSSGKWAGCGEFFGHSFMTTLSVAGFQKELRYEPSYPWGRALALLELMLTSTLFALFLLAVRRQFKR